MSTSLKVNSLFHFSSRKRASLFFNHRISFSNSQFLFFNNLWASLLRCSSPPSRPDSLLFAISFAPPSWSLLLQIHARQLWGLFWCLAGQRDRGWGCPSRWCGLSYGPWTVPLNSASVPVFLYQNTLPLDWSLILVTQNLDLVAPCPVLVTPSRLRNPMHCLCRFDDWGTLENK